MSEAMDEILRISGVVEESIVDGPGIRFVVFTQGCHHKCDGCHNPHTHSVLGGYNLEIEKIIEQIRSNPLLDGVTISGGEPFIQAKQVYNLIKRLKMFKYHILVYSGYKLEELIEMAKKDEAVKNILLAIDVLVDGRFEKDKMDYTLKFRGSSNQNIINLKEIGISNII